MQGELSRKAGEELIKLASRHVDLLQDARTAMARLILDLDSGEAGFEVGLTGRPGSKLAKSIAEREPSTNKFAGLITSDTVIGLKLQLPLFAQEIQNAAAFGLEAGMKEVGEKAPPQYKA